MNQYTDPGGPGYVWFTAHIGHVGEECLIWPYSCCTAGYGSFMFKRKLLLAHREMCRVTHGEPPTPKHHAAHSCGNRRCINPAHLSWKTAKDNQLDRRRHGTQTVSGRRKITLQQAEQIKRLKGMETSIVTAARYGVTESNVRLIQSGKTWQTENRKHNLLLTADQVRAIRKIGRSQSNTKTAAEFGIHKGAVWRILNGRSYRGVA